MPKTYLIYKKLMKILGHFYNWLSILYPIAAHLLQGMK
jgi:hypothetical protein